MTGLQDALSDIDRINAGLSQFWRHAQGWAPVEAAGLLSQSRLDRQASLSRTMRMWFPEDGQGLSDGELILAWANLGSLLEGTLKTFLSVYYQDYLTDPAAPIKHGTQTPPDAMMLEPLIQFFQTKSMLSGAQLALCRHIQQRRNAIHAYKDRDIGDVADLADKTLAYRDLLKHINARLPYPHEHFDPDQNYLNRTLTIRLPNPDGSVNVLTQTFDTPGDSDTSPHGS